MGDREAKRSLQRLLPRLGATFAGADAALWEPFQERLEVHFENLFGLLLHLYGDRYDFFYHLERILETAARMWLARQGELRALDAEREANPCWFQSEEMLGGVCYVDLFARNLAGIRAKIPYFRELGLTYLHLMPLFLSPEGDNDGGYAVSSYREVNPALGTMDELADLTAELRRNGISTVLDLVYNHTSDEHEWARRALAGDEDYQEYYLMFPDRRMPDAYDAHLREIFPEVRRGSFTYQREIDRWVWTTFHSFQWDLNYQNPEVFHRMAEEMLLLANRGVEVLRLDAVAFLWKRLGTNCQNLPESHRIIQAFNAVAAIAAPATVLLSEAIVHPDEVRKYISAEECPLSYNPQLMALLWEALATRDVRVLRSAMESRIVLPGGCSWLNYVRCHDDIGWAFSDEEVEAVGFDPREHRRFLTAFYTGKHEGTFARGEPFQSDSRTGDARVSGTCASLAGVEMALQEEDAEELELAVRRVLLIHGVIVTITGIPLLYLGDEIGMLNDSSYEEDPEKVGDTRWLHRPAFDWERAEMRRDPETVPGRIYHGLLRLLQLRTQNQAFRRSDTEIADTGNKHVLGFLRSGEDDMVFVLANFSEEEQPLEARRLRQMGMRKTFVDLYAGRTITATRELILEPYQLMVLRRVNGG